MVYNKTTKIIRGVYNRIREAMEDKIKLKGIKYANDTKRTRR